MKRPADFGDILDRVVAGIAGSEDALPVAEELDRLGAEVGGLFPDAPLPPGVAAAYRTTDGAGTMAAPLTGLAAEIIADHAPAESGWDSADIHDYLTGLGPAKSAEFLTRLAARVRAAAADSAKPGSSSSG